MCVTLRSDSRGVVVTAGASGLGSTAAGRLREVSATAVTTGRAVGSDPVPRELFAAAGLTAAKRRAVFTDRVPLVTCANAPVGNIALKRGLVAQVPAAPGITPDDPAGLNFIERLVTTFAVGFAVFSISVGAFLMVFTWWILVAQPSAVVEQPGHVTMPLFPDGYPAPPNDDLRQS